MSDFWVAIVATALSIRSLAEHCPTSGFLMPRDPLARSMRPRSTFCYGAKSCLVGRAYIYGLGAGGETDVAWAIDIIRKELDVSVALTGVKSIPKIGRQFGALATIA
jgi:hypothetical protein